MPRISEKLRRIRRKRLKKKLCYDCSTPLPKKYKRTRCKRCFKKERKREQRRNRYNLLCRYCGSSDIKKKGYRGTFLKGKIQRYLCGSCGRQFSGDGFRFRAHPDTIRQIINLHKKGLSIGQISKKIKIISYVAVANIINKVGGVGGQFKKGHIPWNKELKGIRLNPATEFKKGQHSITFKGYYIPHIFKRKNKRYEVVVTTPQKRKVYNTRDKKVYNTRKRIPYARYLWQKHYGKIPKGMVVYNIDQDSPTDIKIENLILITRAELIMLNCKKS